MTTTSPDEIRDLAGYCLANGMSVKHNMLIDYADTIELMQPVVQAVSEMQKSDEEFSRRKVQERIDELDQQ